MIESDRRRPDVGPTSALVTGGQGFIGSHLVDHLARRGLRVVVVDGRSGEPAYAPARRGSISTVLLDVANFDDCLRIVRSEAPSYVFHLAATATLQSSREAPYRSLSSNMVGTLNMLEATRRAAPHLRRFVLTSTDKVYGELLDESYVETDPLRARGVYDVGKLAADQLVELYGHELGLPVTTLRLCNVIGPGDRNRSSRIVPRSLSRLFDFDAPLPPLVYAGSMSHGRDYVHVDDVVRALDRLAMSDRACGEAFNMLPAGHRTTLDLVEDIVDRAVHLCGPIDPDRAVEIRKNGYEIVRGDDDVRELHRQHCDASKLTDLVGFRNELGLTEAIDATVAAHIREWCAA